MTGTQSRGRPPRRLIQAALRGEARGYADNDNVHRLVTEGAYNIPVNISIPPEERKRERSYATADLDQKLVAYVIGQEEHYKRRHHRAVIRKLTSNPTYLSSYIELARRELDQRIIGMETEVQKYKETAVPSIFLKEGEERIYQLALTQANEEGHACCDQFPQAHMNQAGEQVLEQITKEVTQELGRREEVIQIIRESYNIQVLGMTMQKAVAAEKQAEKRARELQRA